MKIGDIVKHRKRGWHGIVIRQNPGATNVTLATVWFDVLWEAGNIKAVSNWDLEVIGENR